MPEQEKIFSTKMNYNGLFNFKSFYKFCYDWLVDETNLLVSETKYTEKIKGDEKEVEYEWEGVRKITDYFKFGVVVKVKIVRMKDVEVAEGNKKIPMNTGEIGMGVSGKLIRDYEGKFEKSAFNKFLRAIYEKWVIKARISQFEEKLIGDLDEYLGQTKAYLDLSGKR